MSTLAFNAQQFRVLFPAFGNTLFYSDETLQIYWDAATIHVSPQDCGALDGNARLRAIYLMMAHMMEAAKAAASGDSIGVIQSATIEKISVSMVSPPIGTQLQWWLSTTAYGRELLIILSSAAVCGMYINGRTDIEALGW
jgi:hypothetical protein